MPYPKKGESESAYVSRCISRVMHEGGRDTKQAAGKCYGMWRTYKGAKKAVRGNKPLEVR